MQAIISSGVMWSSEVKKGLLKHHDMKLMDTMGSTEGGIGSSIATRDNPSETAKFSINPGVIVLADDGEILAARIRENWSTWNFWTCPSRLLQG